MNYVLIIMVLTGYGGPANTSVFTQEFSSKDRCEIAGTRALELSKNVKFVCVEK